VYPDLTIWTTRLSVVERIRTSDAEARRLAYSDVVEGYWRPVYTHLRLTWKLSADDAQDLAQGFFAEAFQKAWLERFDPGKARFRTFVRMCADRYVMNVRQSDGRVKRGGGVELLSLDYRSAEQDLAVDGSSPSDPEVAFQQEFVRALFERAVTTLRRELEAEGRHAHFALFERYDLAHEDGITYAQLAGEAGLSTTQVTNRLAQVRRRFREIALGQLRALCGSDDEFSREAREMFGVETT
jgi:DNA-directed RNA polymerase specialized sigma24 family protein